MCKNTRSDLFKKILLYDCLHFLPWNPIYFILLNRPRETRSHHHQAAPLTKREGFREDTLCLTPSLPCMQAELQRQQWEQWEGVCSGHGSPSPSVSFTASLLLDLTWLLRLFPGLSPPSWECSFPKSRNLARLAHPTSPRRFRPSLALGSILCGMSFLRPGQESWLQKQPCEKGENTSPEADSSSGKILQFLQARKVFFQRIHNCFLIDSFPASTDLGSVGLKKQPSCQTPSPLGNLYLRVLSSSLKWKGVERSREIMAGGIKKIEL